MGEHTSTEDFGKTSDMVPNGSMQTSSIRIAAWVDEEGEEMFAVNVSRDTKYGELLGLLSAAQAFINDELVNHNEGDDG